MAISRYKAHFGEGAAPLGLCPRGLQPVSEARFFLKAVLRGATTFEQAKLDILMTSRQLWFLIHTKADKPDTLRAIAFNRARTWTEFCRMHKSATRKRAA